MSDVISTDTRAERSEKLFNAITGWAALVVGVLAIHRWALVGGYPWGERWTQGGLIVAIGLFFTWLWGYWGFVVSRTRAWYRAGGLNTVAIAVGLVLCLVVVNTIVRRRFPVKWDLTKNQRYTLSERSVKIIKNLQGPLHATVFIPSGSRSASPSKARDLFNQYKDASDKFTWTHVDPMVDQATLIKMNPKLSPPDFTGAVLEYNGKREEVSDFSEKAVTSAVLKLTRDTRRKLLFTKGHGEPDIVPGGADPSRSIATLLADLRDQQWLLESIDLLAKDTKAPDPAQVAALVIIGPERDLAPEEQKKVNEFLNKGGHVLLALNPRGASMSKFLEPWGMKTGADVVIDATRQQGLVVIDAAADAHPAVKPGKRTIFQLPHSVVKAATVPSGITVTELLKTGPQAQDVPFTPGKPANLAAAKTGAVSIAALAEKSMGTGEDKKSARLLVIGDSGFMSDVLARLVSYDEALASGLINYLGEEEALVAIPPKDENTEQAFLTPDQGRLFALINIWDFPLLALVLAIVVYLKRR